MKWFPHNWLCLKGLSILFLVLFYFSFACGFYYTWVICKHPAFSGALLYKAIAYYLLSCWGAAVGFLTIAKVLQALRKIKQAVAPCCCQEHNEDKKKEESK